MFYESSTRTRISFEEAGKVLSADVINMSSSGSSVDKGESLLNTGLTLQAMGVDVVVIRHPYSGAPYLLARHLPQVSVINAGDGLHAHPTQALLDLYTMRERLGSLRGARVVIVGDVLHSRVARSNLWGLTKVGAQVTLSGPTTLMPLDLLSGRDELEEDHPFAQVEVDTDLDRAIEGADVVMALRFQSERQKGGFLAQSAGVYKALAGYGGTVGPGQARRPGNASWPHERRCGNQHRSGPWRKFGH